MFGTDMKYRQSELGPFATLFLAPVRLDIFLHMF